jgi:ubiquitin-like protein Pup
MRRASSALGDSIRGPHRSKKVEWLEKREEPVVPQEQEQKKIQKKSGGGSEEDAGQVQSIAKGEKLKEEMGEILDEIDSVLEENAEEFVNSYIQKGGE